MKKKKPSQSTAVNIAPKPVEETLTPEEQAFRNLDSGAKNAFKRWQQASGNPNGTVTDWRIACIKHKQQKQQQKAKTDINDTAPYILMNGVQGLQMQPLSNNG